jgi:hypothetical protein
MPPVRRQSMPVDDELFTFTAAAVPARRELFTRR